MSTALLSARIFTGSDDTPWAEAVFIEGNTITQVGSNAQIKEKCTGDTQVIDLSGKFVVPGFVDAHIHFWTLGQTLSMVDLRGLTSIKACQDVIAAAVKDTAPGEWVLGRNWNQNIWTDGREPNRHDLDLIAPDNPVVMIRICGHASWVNSMALDKAGVTADTPEPAGGQIHREPRTNYPSGLILETREVVEDAIPSRKMTKKDVLKCQEYFLKSGFTCVHTFETLEEYKVIHEVEKDGELKLRIYHAMHIEDLERFDEWSKTSGPQSDKLWHGHIKMFSDGALGVKTAYLHEPYFGSDQDYGFPVLTAEQLQANVEKAYRSGRSVLIHAIGDRGLTMSLDAIESARQAVPGRRSDRIEHAQLCRPEDLVRMKNMDIAASVQPIAIQTDRDVAYRFWGPERCRNAYVWKSMEDKGIRLIFLRMHPLNPSIPWQVSRLL